jgi:hypothetical protein
VTGLGVFRSEDFGRRRCFGSCLPPFENREGWGSHSWERFRRFLAKGGPAPNSVFSLDQVCDV